MTWATATDVEDITGHGATTADVAAANAHVTIYANRTPDASAGIGARDLYWLKQAACWQAAWLTQQPAVDGRSAHTSISQDGLSVTQDAEHQIVLGPLAARSLRNLSWKSTRSLRVDPVNTGPTWPARFLSESSDDEHGWEPLKGIG
jgi:hypothetical protein